MSKERYELRIYAGCESYSITDTKEKQQLPVENAVNLLNKYDQQIAELKAENERLQQEYDEMYEDIYDRVSEEFKLNNGYEFQINSAMNEIEKLQQQLKDNTKKVCEKIREFILNRRTEIKYNFTDYAKGRDSAFFEIKEFLDQIERSVNNADK